MGNKYFEWNETPAKNLLQAIKNGFSQYASYGHVLSICVMSTVYCGTSHASLHIQSLQGSKGQEEEEIVETLCGQSYALNPIQ